LKRATVIIGVNKTGGLPPLESAVLGAKRVAEWLRKEEFDSVLCLTDDDGPVTSSAVEQAVKGLVTLPARYHFLVVYFSGRGLWQARSDVWLLSGAPESANEAINLNASMDLAKYSGIPNVVFVSDACRSIPNARDGIYVAGIPVFPNHKQITKASKIDYFKPPRCPPMSTSILPKIAIGAALAGVAYYLFKGQSGGGQDLWPALGFPYGPTGNLAAIGSAFQSMPVADASFGVLNDQKGQPLTDESGNLLYDYNMYPSPPGSCNSELLINYNISGSRPS
jgi:hypothetical protein